MSLQQRSEHVSVSLDPPYENGPPTATFDRSPHPPSNICISMATSSINSTVVLSQETPSSTPECPRQNKRKISNDNHSISKKATLVPSSQILVRDSTGKDPVSSPFWNESTLVLSRKLWLPTATDSVVSDTNFSNGCSQNTTRDSWCSINKTTARVPPTHTLNWQKTCSQLQPCSPPGVTDYARPSIGKIGGIRKIKLVPTFSEAARLRQWIGTARWTYNQSVARAKAANDIHRQRTRAAVLHNRNFKGHPWVLETPYTVRDGAVQDFIKAVKASVKKYGKRNGVSRMQFRSRKDVSQTIIINARNWNKGAYKWLCEMQST